MYLQPNVEPSWKTQLQETLLEKLYNPLRSKLTAEADNLLIEHRGYRNIPATTTVHAYFNGLTYISHADIEGDPSDKFIELHPKFHKSMNAIKDEYMELNAEREEVKIFFRRLLNFCATHADVAELLPNSLYRVEYGAQTITLNSTEIDKFRRENLAPVEIIKRRLVHNLLLK